MVLQEFDMQIYRRRSHAHQEGRQEMSDRKSADQLREEYMALRGGITDKEREILDILVAAEEKNRTLSLRVESLHSDLAAVEKERESAYRRGMQAAADGEMAEIILRAETLRGQRDVLVKALRHVAAKGHYGAQTAGIIDNALAQTTEGLRYVCQGKCTQCGGDVYDDLVQSGPPGTRMYHLKLCGPVVAQEDKP
jgi:F0F1-type ATP synthase epsilon subunit